jgi:ElaB/YqjD/DUF883 family membrane-anchored ribosome-binding protein
MTVSNDVRPLGKELADDCTPDLKQRIQDRARELVDHGKDAMQDMRANMRGQVRDRPMTSLVVAGSFGLLLGLLLGRKR